MGTRRPLIERLMDRVDKVSSPDGCWLWTGARQTALQPYDGGYGVIWVSEQIVDGKRVQTFAQVHVVSYEHHHGQIPDGHVVDHVYERGCHNRHCVNPDHLEAVTQHENSERGGKATRDRRSKNAAA